MTFKMLIVDDEPIICRGLKDTIPWEKYNIEVIDTAHDGQDAIRKVQENENVDLIITDVRMPNMDGLQLTSFIHQHYPNIRMIMVSGYEEFSYAQKAIQLGVKDYLLKPVNIEELVSRVVKLTHEIGNEQKLNRMISDLHLKDDVNIPHSAVERKSRSVQVYPYKLEESLIDTIFQLEPINLEYRTEELFDYFEKEEFILDEVVRVSSEILNRIMNHPKLIQSNILNGLDINYKQVIDMDLKNSYQMLKELFDEDLATIAGKLNFKNIDKTDWLIGKAEEYIKEYYKSNIRAHEVADIINISPNYFSSLFNQQTGKSFNEYINDLRIEEAKTLLIETPFKVHEIAELVGFKEYKYFVKVFKEFSNLTPMKYRKLMTTK